MNPIAARAVTTGMLSLATIAAARVAEYGWSLTRGVPPPTSDDADDETPLAELLLWSLTLSTAVLIARRLAKRQTTRFLAR